MRKLRIQLSNRPGFTMILAMMLMAVFIGAAVMAVDVGHMRLIRADVHAAADAAALAGIEKYGATRDTVLARKEAQLFAAKFKADVDTLTIAHHTVGGWDSTKAYPAAFVALGTAGSIPADDVVVQHLTNYFFAKALAGHIQQHNASATSIAVGAFSKSVTQSTCIAPIVMPMSALFQQIGEPAKGDTGTLSASDVSKLGGTPSKLDTLQLQNGTPGKINTLNGVFYQAELPPFLRADGTVLLGQSNSASQYRNAITCTGGVPVVGVGDWLGGVNGVDTKATSQGLDNARNGNPYPITVEVILTDSIGSPPAIGKQCPCLRVGYVGAFTFTIAPPNKSVIGYFTTLDPLSGGIVKSDTAAGPLTLFSRIRLVY